MFYPHTTLTLTLTPSYPHTPTLPARKRPACWGFYGWASDSIGRAQKSSCLSAVQLCCTFGAKMLYSSGTARTVGIPMLDCWYSYAEPLVYLCWTFGIPMLNLWYQNALLFWYRFFNLFTDNIKVRIRMKKRSSAAEGKANEELSAVGRLRNKIS